ncbi:probable cytochrome P450 12b2, mitochondrial [Lutzomyia longipalpis]|uniref:probable cytochrome P450 12b2, mitochondrial n=1 Tax=Lutzomyia longipalpis TaxID=7200 RepID=UPI0024840149|nr:probable cytochrome P450 12b2, mitochondrial [Lutzomyia longipalpis]
MIFLTDPNDFEKVFRTEGKYPMRDVMESVDYYRKVYRPEKFKHGSGLITQSGPDWSFFRQKSNPLFLNTNIRNLYWPHVDEVAKDFMKLLWSMETVVYILVGLRMGYTEGKYEKLEKVMNFVDQFFTEIYKLNQRPSPWKYIWTPTFQKHVNNQDIAYQFTYEIIEEAMKNLQKKPLDGYERCMLAKIMDIDPNISLVILQDSIIAGLETTAFIMTGFLYAIAKNQDKQQLIREEIQRNFPGKNAPLSAEKLSNLTYTKLALKESLRLLPYFSGVFRQTGENITIKGYQIPKNTFICMNTNLASLEEKNFADPESFKPERWIRKNRDEKINPFLTLPFGYGRRMCIGKRMVEVEIEVLLTYLLRKYHIELKEEYLTKEYLPFGYPMENLRFRLTEIPD